MPFLDLDGRRIHYREAGRGPLVIALHSSSSHSGQWKAFMEAVEDRYRVIAPDLHGYGRSDPLPEDGEPFFVHDTNIVNAILESCGPAHLVGHSLGGATALAVARQSNRLVSLTMIEPVLFGLLMEAGDPEADDPIAFHADVASRMGRNDVEGAARAFVAFWSGDDAFEAMAPHVQDYVIATMGRVLADFDGLMSIAPNALKLSDVRDLRVAVHLVFGGRTRAAAKAIVRLLAEAVPGHVLTEVPGAVHMTAATDPGLINPHIAAFLDANNGTGRA